MKNILVLCTGNSCRSQMAEGFLRKYLNENHAIYSAGIETHGVNPKAIETMKKIGIDISDHTSNHVDEFTNLNFDYVLTVCDHARETCPFIPAKNQNLHHNFPDPAKAIGDQDSVSKAFEQVRNEIDVFCQNWAQQILSK